MLLQIDIPKNLLAHHLQASIGWQAVFKANLQKMIRMKLVLKSVLLLCALHLCNSLVAYSITLPVEVEALTNVCVRCPVGDHPNTGG